MSAAQSGVATGDWDRTVHAWGGHVLQSTAWQRVQAALGYPVLHERGETWSWAGVMRTGRFPRYVYVPYGPTVGADPLGALAAVAAAAHEHGVDFARVEPVGADAGAALHDAGAVRARSIQPSRTWVLDISRDVGELRRGLAAGHRGSINAAPRRGLRIRSSDAPSDVTILIALQRRSAGARRHTGQSDTYHRVEAEVLMPLGAARMYIAEAADTPVAAALCFDWAGTRYYAHAASDPTIGRRLGAAAPLVWQMILDARDAGLASFDFWGVEPGAPAGHPWAGFSRFKMAFGGELVERVGTWEIAVHRLRHRLYRAARRLR